MKKFRSLVRAPIIFILVLSLTAEMSAFFCRAGAEEIPISAKSAVLMDFDSGSLLYTHNADQKMGMASTTKIMTALTVLSLLDKDTVIAVPHEAVGTEGSSVYLCEGERLTVGELLYALLLSSANDAAVALAIGASGSISAFADKMNTLAVSLGALDSHFVNPHGLFDENHYTTARDLALLSRAALADEYLREIFATYKKTIPLCGKPDGRLLVNHNKMLRTYDGAIGMKTGFTKKTGRCLVSAAERDGLTLICVTLSAPDDWRDHTAMLDYGFESYTRVRLADVGEYTCTFPMTGSAVSSVTLCNTSPLELTLPKGCEEPKFELYSSYRFIYSPPRIGFCYATVSVSAAGQSTFSEMKIVE